MSDFIDFASFMGLNEGAGKQILEKTLNEGEQKRAAAERANEMVGEGAQTEDAGAFDALKEKARTTLSDYSSFMARMNDPAARQALIEKAYGRGSGGWLDSAVSGGGSGRKYLDQQTGNFKEKNLQYGADGVEANKRFANYGAEQSVKRTRDVQIKESEDLQRQEDERDALGQKWAMEQFSSNNSRNEVEAARNAMDPRARQASIDAYAQRFGAKGKNGKIDWTRYGMGWESEERGRMHRDQMARGPISLSGDVGKPTDHSPNTWDSYYAKNRKY